MSELITMDGEYVTRDGKSVRIIAVDLHNPDYPVAAIAEGESGFDVLRQYTRNGCYWTTGWSPHDLKERTP